MVETSKLTFVVPTHDISQSDVSAKCDLATVRREVAYRQRILDVFAEDSAPVVNMLSQLAGAPREKHSW